MYCRQCGQVIHNQVVFCSRCGARQATAAFQAGIMPVPPAAPVRAKRRPSRQSRLLIRVALLAAVLILVGLAVWQAGAQVGWWRQIQLDRAAGSWRSQPDCAETGKAIQAALLEMADDLDDGQTEQALAWIHPDRQEIWRSRFAEYPERIPRLTAALRSVELVFLSGNDGNYEAARMARVSAMLPDGAANGGRAFTLVLVWYEDRWVIDS